MWEGASYIVIACDSYYDFLDGGLLLTMKLLNLGFLLVKLKTSQRMLYCRNPDLVNCYAISVSQMIMVMLHLSYALSGPLLIHDLSPRVTRFLVGFVLLDLSFSVWCFLDRCLFFCPFCLWPLWCLSFDLRILIAPLVSSNSSCAQSFSCLLAFYKSNIYHTDLQKYIHTCICIKWRTICTVSH